MKKRFNILTTIMLAGAMLSVSSCLKDASHTIDFAGSIATVELPLSAPSDVSTGPFVVESFAISNTPSVLPLIVNLASPKTSSTPVTVTLALDPQDLAAYNAADSISQGADYVPYTILPTADYSIANLTVTIPAGQRTATVKISINSSLVDPSGAFILPLKIVKSSVAINQFNYILYNIGAKNPYDGDFSIKGFVFRDVDGANDPTLGGNFSGYSESLATLGPTTVSFFPLWNGGAEAGGLSGTTITVNPTTNAVTLSSSGNATLMNAPNYNNRYDPTTQTFYISYVWGVSPNDRAETDTLTYTGSR